MGIDKLHYNLAHFGFGQKTGVDLPGEFAGILPSREWKKINLDEPWYRGETLNAGIGQGFMTASPLQLALATAAIANKGQLLVPQLLMPTSLLLMMAQVEQIERLLHPELKLISQM